MIDAEARLSELVESLRDGNGRLTPQRMAILRVLAYGEEHPTAEEIHEEIKKEFPMTSLATVYKTLSALKEIGEVREAVHLGGKIHFDGKHADPHPHLVCTSCNAVQDVDIKEIRDLINKASEKTGFEFFDHRLTFFGLCPKCKIRRS